MRVEVDRELRRLGAAVDDDQVGYEGIAGREMRNHIGARPDRTDHLYGELNTASGGVRHLASQCARTALDVYGDLDGVESRGCTLEVDGRDCTHEGLPATQNKGRYRA